MTQYKCVLAYDGTDYQGWQVQPNRPTIAQRLQDTFYEVFGKEIQLLGASRTDAGVHANCQVARFFLDTDIPTENMLKAWNDRLPRDISIRSLEKVPDSFYPMGNVKQKEYRYTFYLEQPPFYAARYAWHFPREVDVEKLKEALTLFVGTHDFRSFCTGYEMNSTVRTIDSIDILHQNGAYTIVVKGPGFLRYQIRRMVGAALAVASNPALTVNYLKEVLENRNAEHHLPTAPAHGLVLHEITYNE